LSSRRSTAAWCRAVFFLLLSTLFILANLPILPGRVGLPVTQTLVTGYCRACQDGRNPVGKAESGSKVLEFGRKVQEFGI
jgi:hypothetical protein